GGCGAVKGDTSRDRGRIMELEGLKEKVVVVTGAAGNLGAACARVLREAGAQLVLVDHSLDRLTALVPDWAPSHVLANGVDLAAAHAAGAVARAVLDRFGRVDALVHTVGGFAGGKPAWEADESEWDRMLALNLRTTVNAVRAFVPPMVARRSGRVVAVGARAGLQGMANFAAYSASKAALLRLMETLAAELRDCGVTANCVLPSILDTPQNRAAMPGADFTRWVAPEQVAGAAAFLLSDAGRDISGAAIPVYGRA
ncbi:MAG TPA: SDR family NAD(P)-dependent oxidoreductase, partial [Burkholderiales bacterium]